MDETNLSPKKSMELLTLSSHQQTVLGGNTSSTSLYNNSQALPSHNITMTNNNIFLLQQGRNVTGNTACFIYQLPSSSVQTSHLFSTYVCLSIIIIGVSCNILGMIVFNSKAMRRSITAVYLFALALSDSAYLIVFFLSRTLTSIKCMHYPNITVDLYHSSQFGCKGLQYFIDVFSDFSACIILVVTIERYIACYHPVMYKGHCSLKTARVVSLSLIVTLMIINIPHHVLLVEHFPDLNICDHSQKYERVFDYVYMTEVTLFRILPTFSIAVFNTSIIVKLYKRVTEKQMRKSSDRSSVTSRISNISCLGHVSGESAHTTNVILVLISTTYIICYLPILVCYILNKLMASQVISMSMETWVITQNYSKTLNIFGYGVNFFFYTLAGRVFRNEIIKLLCCTKFKRYNI